MEFKKPLSEHQKRSLSNAITALNNPIFSTQALNVSGNQLFRYSPGAYSDKTLPQPLNFGAMKTAEITYTTPKLFKAKKIDQVPKGSTKAREEAKQSWYIEFFFYDPATRNMERFRFSKNLNLYLDGFNSDILLAGKLREKQPRPYCVMIGVTE